MALPFNPLSLVTPYTAVSTANPGKAFNDARAQAVQSQVSQGYLANTQHQTAEADMRHGQEEVDKARAQLDQAMELGNSDVVESALNNLRAVGQRYGITVNETRSDAKLTSSVKTPIGKQEAAPEPAESPPPSQEDFERDLIANDNPPERYERSGKTIPEVLRVMRTPGGSLPQEAPQTVDMGDVDSPEFKAAAAAESGVRVPGGSLPQVTPAAPEAPSDGNAPLQGYSLNGPDGKPMYSVAPRDVVIRQRQRVTNVFDGLASKTNDPDEKALIGQAQATAERLVGVRPIDEAVKEGLLLYTQGMQRINALKVTDLNHRGRFLGGGGTGGLIGKNDDRAESTDKYGDNIEMALQHRGIPAAETALSQAEGALLSGDPALQKDALKIILKARSGLTVSEAERQSYSMVDGALPAISNAIAQWTGEPLDEQTVQSYLGIVRNMHRANEATSRSIIAYERHKYEAQNRRKVADPILKERSESLDPNVIPSAPSPGKKSVKDLE